MITRFPAFAVATGALVLVKNRVCPNKGMDTVTANNIINPALHSLLIISRLVLRYAKNINNLFPVNTC
jgi:hypothetical protein